MFKNLRAEMAREGISNKAVAAAIGISDKAFRNKLNGISDFTRKEMLKIKALFPSHIGFEYLFDLNDPREKKVITLKEFASRFKAGSRTRV